MPISIDKKELCVGCSACFNICPNFSIGIKPDVEGFVYPIIDENKCIKCGLCETVCPIIHCTDEPKDRQPAAYAVQNNDETERFDSSSGGVFSLLAKKVIEQNGIVFGAAFTEHLVVSHISIDSIEKLNSLRGSKYVQSNIGNTYREAKKYLDDKIAVLFSGTPCQIEGLLSFLGKKYDNLITVDIICHGVPSPLLWKKYIQYYERGNNSKITRVSFRNKQNGWKNYQMMLEFQNSEKLSFDMSKDYFLCSFLDNICLRPSCYVCKFKKNNRMSDITIADFWGIGDVLPKIDDNKGTSLVLVHSEKGKQALESIKKQCIVHSTDYLKSIAENPSMVFSAEKPISRDRFMSKVRRFGYPKLFYITEVYKNMTLKKKLKIRKRNLKYKIKMIFERN